MLHLILVRFGNYYAAIVEGGTIDRWFLVSGFWFLVSGFWFVVSGFWFVVSGL